MFQLILFFIFSQTVYETTENETEKVLVNQVHENIIECIAYYEIATIGLENKNSDDPLVPAMRNRNIKLMNFAMNLHTRNVTEIRFNNAINRITSEMENDFGYFSQIQNRYNDKCQTILNKIFE